MPQLTPFAGLRPEPTVTGPLEGIICPPYDVITEGQRAHLLARSPHNVVRVELPNGDYEQAAKLLAEWRSAGALVREDGPVLYGYRMSYNSPDGGRRQTLGVVGALVLEPPGQGILPHEQTTPKARSDRLDLIRATRANTSPIWCLCSEKGLAAAIGPLPTASMAVAGAIDDEGTHHEIWPIREPGARQAIAEVIGAAPLLVADGHHRYETALAYQSERAGGGAGQGHDIGADAVMALVVELSEEHLAVLAIHRAVSGLPDGFDLPAALRPHFDLDGTTAAGAELLEEMVAARALGVVTATGTCLARPRADGLAGHLDLDSSRIDTVLATLPSHHLTYEHDLTGAETAVKAGQLDFAVFCRPATVAQIAETAHGGKRMPPKTTFFWPKPRTGMVLRALD